MLHYVCLKRTTVLFLMLHIKSLHRGQTDVFTKPACGCVKMNIQVGTNCQISQSMTAVISMRSEVNTLQ